MKEKYYFTFGYFLQVFFMLVASTAIFFGKGGGVINLLLLYAWFFLLNNIGLTVSDYTKWREYGRPLPRLIAFVIGLYSVCALAWAGHIASAVALAFAFSAEDFLFSPKEVKEDS